MLSPTNPVILNATKEAFTINQKVIKLILAIIILGATASICLSHWGTRATAATLDQIPSAFIAPAKTSSVL
ncbi:hypothetical protein [Levilactobacillus sp. HBUAS67488]|uniref:hypothetical protein n=1 Tax=Levilactobacillus sp. HBUAS67488 TaxID=3109361 RepID=UPI002FEE9A71